MLSEKKRLLVLSVTNECNLHCKYCIARKNGLPPHGKMNMDLIPQFRKLIPYVDAVLFIGGGDPLLYTEFILEFLKIYFNDFRTFTIQTNGTIQLDEFLEKLKPYKDKTNFCISYDDKFNFYRTEDKAHLEIIKHNLNLFKNNEFKLHIATLFYHHDMKDFYKTVLHIYNNFSKKIYISKYCGIQTYDLETSKKYCNELKKLILLSNFKTENFKDSRITPPMKFNTNTSPSCKYQLDERIQIGIDGKVYLEDSSLMKLDEKYCLGDIDKFLNGYPNNYKKFKNEFPETLSPTFCLYNKNKNEYIDEQYFILKKFSDKNRESWYILKNQGGMIN